MQNVNNYLGWCADLAKRLGIKKSCCDSCHEDEDAGLSIPIAQFDDGYYDCCCKMKDEFDKVNNAKDCL